MKIAQQAESLREKPENKGLKRKMVQARAPGPTRQGGLNHPFYTRDIEHPFDIVGSHHQAHLRFHLVQYPGQEIPLVHTAFHRAKRMLDDRLSTPHLLWMKTVPAFHVVQNPFFG
jgi:hypothetical protein